LLTMVVGALFPAIGTIHHYMQGILIEGTRASWVGVFKNPNEDAYSLAIMVPIAAALAGKSRWFGRILLWTAIGIYLAAIFLTFSRGGLLGLLAVVGLMVWKQRSFVLRVLMIAAVVACLSFAGAYWARNRGFDNVSSDVTFNQRIATIEAGLLMFTDYPLFGVGPGCSIVAFPLYVPEKYLDCGCQTNLVIHNSFIQVLSELGAIGFVLFTGLLGLSLLEARRMQTGPITTYAAGLEIALWGFVVCSLSSGFAYSWWPYILFALVIAARRVSDHQLAEARK
jgi:O-antigen ligase